MKRSKHNQQVKFITQADLLDLNKKNVKQVDGESVKVKKKNN